MPPRADCSTTTVLRPITTPTPNSPTVAATEAGSVFSKSSLNITQFTTQFTFWVTGGTNTGDGFTFTLQGNSPAALRIRRAAALGYGSGRNQWRTAVIPNSLAVKFDLYSNQGEGPDLHGDVHQRRLHPGLPSIDLSTTGINFHSGDVFQVNMTYNGATLGVTILDKNNAASASQSYTVNLCPGPEAAMPLLALPAGAAG